MKIELLSKDKLTFFPIDVIQEVDRVFDNTITDIAIIPVYNLKKYNNYKHYDYTLSFEVQH